MITRRAFITGVSAALTLPIYEKFYSHIEIFGEPFIESPKRPDKVLYVDPGYEWQIGLNGKPGDFDFPKLPLREALIRVTGLDPSNREDLKVLQEECGYEGYEVCDFDFLL